MPIIKYNKEMVNRSVELLSEAQEQLKDTQAELTKALDGFAGLAYFNDYVDKAYLENKSRMEELPDECMDYIFDIMQMVIKKQQEIEDYVKGTSGPLGFFKGVGATYGMLLSKFGDDYYLLEVV